MLASCLPKWTKSLIPQAAAPVGAVPLSRGLGAWDPCLCSGSDVPVLLSQLQFHIMLPPCHLLAFSHFHNRYRVSVLCRS